jgi:hypothetical protein
MSDKTLDELLAEATVTRDADGKPTVVFFSRNLTEDERKRVRQHLGEMYSIPLVQANPDNAPVVKSLA